MCVSPSVAPWVCWDNAQQDSFWSTLKSEFYDRCEFTTRTTAVTAVSRWISQFHNRQPKHSALGNITPAVFEDIKIHETTGQAA